MYTEGNVVQCIQKAMELQMYTEGNGAPNVYRRQMSYDICYQNAMKLYLYRLKWEIYVIQKAM